MASARVASFPSTPAVASKLESATKAPIAPFNCTRLALIFSNCCLTSPVYLFPSVVFNSKLKSPFANWTRFDAR